MGRNLDLSNCLLVGSTAGHFGVCAPMTSRSTALSYRLLLMAVSALAVAWAPLPVIGAPGSFEPLLKHAEAVRSSDPQRFRDELARLNANRAKLTHGEQEQLAYLNAYDDAFRGDFSRAIDAAHALIRTSHDVTVQFQAGTLAVNTFALNGQYGQGLRQLDQTLSLMDRIHDPTLRQLGYGVAATLYNQVGQYGLGQRYAELITSEPASPRTLCFANHVRFDAMLHLHLLPSGDQPLVAAVEQCEGIHEFVMGGFNRITLARKWAAEGRRNEAIGLLQKSLPQAMGTHYPRLIAEFSAQLAELKLAAGDYDGAETDAKAVTAPGIGVPGTPPFVSAYNTLYQVAVHRNQPVAALAYYKQYADARQASLDDVKARELAYHLVRQEARETDQQIELLSRQNNLLQLQQQVDQQQARNSHLLMLLFALGAATISYWGYRTKRMQMAVKRMAESDALTGISNRHHFTMQAERTLARCKATGEPVSVLMFDLDHFKSINDKFGHSTGDWVLKRVADVCTAMCRDIDHLGRVGGEEFAILLHGHDLKAATRMAEDCRVRLSRIDSSPSGHRFPITASFGVSSTPVSGHELDKLLSHADQMLYRAKREGRNRVRAYVPDTSAELIGVNFGTGAETSPSDSMPG